MTAPASMTVFIPLAMRKRNGRPKIVPSGDPGLTCSRSSDPHVLRAVARAWGWRRMLETGQASTIVDIAQAEGITDRFVSHLLKLAYLSPSVLGPLVLEGAPAQASIKDLIAAVDLPWSRQAAAVFGERP